ncbi:MAG TPA: NADH-quinone oxidoreductase subunit L [Ktedonobacterales bacterium]|nr:NADH-quinone oxidoreductase subunit L [Ktedonobacterales bacterium]
MLNLTPFILLLPLAGFVVLGLFGRVLPRVAISLIGCGVVLVAFLLAVADFIAMLGVAPDARFSDVLPWTWVTTGGLTIPFGLLSDPLSAVMLLIVTGVGFLIHVYSIGYMEGDPGYWRFFSFLNFFVFAMALLVAADNFLMLLVGWGNVGLASFLLIGFWYTRPSAVAAARKAFVVNVIGDFGLLLAIFLIVRTFHTLQYSPLFVHSASASGPMLPGTLISVADPNTITAIALLLFVAAAAKSAQLPLHVWLPDAMEGPTPVSALIHAATMVTAGVYLVARMSVLFGSSPTALAVVGIVGGATALFAATIACAHTDIKRVLAYSTMSQLGYMFMGEAAAGFSGSIFHLTTHAYFKALLFMTAGAVIHALAGEQDMSKMGGLRNRLPQTFWLFVVGGLALASIFPLAGFWSKDGILSAVLERAQTSGGTGWYVLYILGLVTAILTGFYIFRLIFGIFLGRYRGGEIAAHGEHAAPATASAGRSGARDPLAHVHEVGPAMMIPMVILGILSVIGGFYGTPWADAIGTFLEPSMPAANLGVPTSSGLFWLAFVLGLLTGPIGIAIAWARYARREVSFGESHNPVVVLLRNRYYIDDLYDAVFVRPVVAISGLWRIGLEGGFFDGGSRGVGQLVGGVSKGLRRLQTGYARNYALAIFIGAALILVYYVIHP